MKYLKTYESMSSITDDLEDILLEIDDIGYKTEVDEITILPYPRTVGSNKKEISITLQEPEKNEEGDSRNEEEISSIYEVLERIDDYMKSKRWTLCRINTKDITDGKSEMKLTSGMKSIDWKTQLFVTLYSSNKVTLYYKPM